MGRFEIVLGRLKIVVDRCGSLWIVVGRCGSFRVLVTTDSIHSKNNNNNKENLTIF